MRGMIKMENMPPLEEDHQFLNQTISSLTDQIDLFETFQGLSLKIVSQFNLQSIFETFSSIVHEIMRYQVADIYLLGDSMTAFDKVWPTKVASVPASDLPCDEKIIQWVMEQGRWRVVTDLQEKDADSIISVLPIKSPKRDHGFMIIQTAFTPSMYNQKIGSILEFLSSQTAIAIQNQGLYTEIKQANAFMHNMLESVTNGIMALDLEGRITLINKNATAIFGIMEKNIIGRHFEDFLNTPMKKAVRDIFSSALAGKMLPEMMLNHTPYKEVDIVVGITASMLNDREGELIGVVFSLRDMTASKEIERLTKLDQLKSEFVSNVSHELRTPLSIIKSYTEALLTQVAPDDKETREKFLSVVDSETDRLSGMVSNLLDLSRIEAGKFKLNYKKIDLPDIINSLLAIQKAEVKNIHFFTEYDEDLPLIDADKDKIHEALLNLISNSIKFSPTGGTVNVSVERKGDFLSCSVADTGIGIPQNQLGRIFEKFYRVDNSDTYEIEGTGLGLSIVKHIIESHKGHIRVESIKGKGSIFTIELPVNRGVV